MDLHVPPLHHVLLRLWNDAEWQSAEREHEEREILELARRLLEWDGCEVSRIRLAIVHAARYPQ